MSAAAPARRQGSHQRPVPAATCRGYPTRDKCTTAKWTGQQLYLRPGEIHEAVAAARAGQDTRQEKLVRARRPGRPGSRSWRSAARPGSPGAAPRPGWQGPPVLRWAVYEADKTHARASAPDHGYYAQVKDWCNGKRAARSEARKILREACHILAELGDDALARLSPSRLPPVTSPVTAPAPARPAAASGAATAELDLMFDGTRGV